MPSQGTLVSVRLFALAHQLLPQIPNWISLAAREQRLTQWPAMTACRSDTDTPGQLGKPLEITGTDKKKKIKAMRLDKKNKNNALQSKVWGPLETYSVNLLSDLTNSLSTYSMCGCSPALTWSQIQLAVCLRKAHNPFVQLTVDTFSQWHFF